MKNDCSKTKHLWCISPIPSHPRSTHLDKKRYHRHHTKNKEIAVRVHVKLPFCRLSLAEYEIYTSFLAVAKYLCARKKKRKTDEIHIWNKTSVFSRFLRGSSLFPSCDWANPPSIMGGGRVTPAGTQISSAPRKKGGRRPLPPPKGECRLPHGSSAPRHPSLLDLTHP